ncbi:hypothetical protein OC835_002678 [Tilletia horrida]|nr:hypothetical protein OC835_002678 [Tilletia horrida]
MAHYHRAPTQDPSADSSSPAYLLQRISAAGWTQETPAPQSPEAPSTSFPSAYPTLSTSTQSPSRNSMPSASSTAAAPAWPSVSASAASPPAPAPAPVLNTAAEQRPISMPHHQSYLSDATIESSTSEACRYSSMPYNTSATDERMGMHHARDPDMSEISNIGGGVTTDATAPLIAQQPQHTHQQRESFSAPPRTTSQHQMRASLSSTSMLSDPPGPDGSSSFAAWSREGARKKRALQNLRTLVLIFGGWGAIIAACLIFKLVAIRVNLVAPDSLAEAIKQHPQMATQIFTILGNILAEFCLLLWATSISYLAFRAVVFGEKIELLTLSAWSEMARGGYTFSRRKLSWPILTPLIWLGALFLSPGFTTLITPVPSSKDTPILTREIDQLSAGFVTHFMNGFLGSGEAALLPINLEQVPTCFNHLEVLDGNSTTVIKCLPGDTDFHTSRQASQASLQAYLGIRQPYVPIFGGWQFFGRTRGLIPLGPDGLVVLTDSDFKRPQPGSVHPKGFPRVYDLDQQGLSAMASCQEMTQAQWDSMITVRQLPQRADAYTYSVSCPNETSFFNGDSSLTTLIANGRSSSMVPLMCYHTNVDRASSRSHTLYLITRGGEAASVLNTTVCTLTPYWHQTRLTYPSTTGILNASVETTRFLSYIDVVGGSPNASEAPYAQFMRDMQTIPATLIRNYLTSFNALGLLSSMVKSNTIMGLASANDSTALGGWSVMENNQVLQHLQNIVLDYDVRSAVTMPMLEQYLLGVWDFHSTTTRQYQTAVLRMVGNNTLEPFHVNADFNDGAVTKPCNGTWHGSTLGWGLGSSGNDVTATVVFVSLIPLMIFALMSWGISLYAHLKYRNGKLAYYGDFDPCDTVQAIIAASAGGMVDAFDPRALSEDAGLHGARKVRVRLGRIYNTSEVGGKVKIGYVTV